MDALGSGWGYSVTVEEDEAVGEVGVCSSVTFLQIATRPS